MLKSYDKKFNMACFKSNSRLVYLCEIFYCKETLISCLTLFTRQPPPISKVQVKPSYKVKYGRFKSCLPIYVRFCNETQHAYGI